MKNIRLDRALPGKETQGEQIRAGHILVEPPDRHVIIYSGKVILTKGTAQKLGATRDRPDVSERRTHLRGGCDRCRSHRRSQRRNCRIKMR